jgi:ribulose-5-phosphate 4-epimerase/fuculose-1-phosphate aldolase
VAHDFGWTDLVNAHFSARVPDEPNWFLINTYGETFDEVTASSLAKMDLDKNAAVEGQVNEFGFAIHSTVYKARPDVNFVMHTHTYAGRAASLLKRGLRPISQDALHVYDDIAYHDYAVPGSDEDCASLAESCRAANCIIMQNHGLLTLGPTVHGAFLRMWTLDRACEIEIAARSFKEPVVVMGPEFVDKTAIRMSNYRNRPDYGLLEWSGAVRAAERRGADFRR